MRRALSLRFSAVRRDPHAARLAVSFFLIGLALAGIVLVPFLLYLWGKDIRNRLTFDVGTFEVALERSARAMAVRERTLRAYLYQPNEENAEQLLGSAEPLRSALAEAASHAERRGLPWLDEVSQLAALAEEWNASAADLAAPPLGQQVSGRRPSPIYDEYQEVLNATLDDVARERAALASDLALADDARLLMPLVLSFLCLPVLVYVLRLSSRVLALLAAARAEQARLASILEHMLDPVLVTDRRGRITLLNPAARTLLGLEEGSAIEWLSPRLRPAPRAETGGQPAIPEMLAAIAQGEPVRAAQAIVERDGEEVPVSISSAPLVADHSVVGAVTALRDLSDRVRYEQKRVEAERFRALGDMAERLAHDFGNYLEAASAATAMLERPSAADPEKRSRWLGIIRATVDEGRAVLASLRTISFVSQAEPRFVRVDLRGLAARAVDVARHARPEAHGVDITVSVPEVPLHVHASESDLSRAIVNVVVNAIDAMPQGGAIRVEASEAGAEARLSVTDTGSGIAAGDLERIFDMYYSTKGERGSGMGLTLAREVLRLHQGDIVVSSTPGAGSTFTLVLPRQLESQSADVARAEARHEAQEVL